jgi:hypothetical protein
MQKAGTIRRKGRHKRKKMIEKEGQMEVAVTNVLNMLTCIIVFNCLLSIGYIQSKNI